MPVHPKNVKTDLKDRMVMSGLLPASTVGTGMLFSARRCAWQVISAHLLIRSYGSGTTSGTVVLRNADSSETFMSGAVTITGTGVGDALPFTLSTTNLVLNEGDTLWYTYPSVNITAYLAVKLRPFGSQYESAKITDISL